MKLNAKPTLSLQGKTALVTGASRGLGQAIAVGLAKTGATVVCASSAIGGTDQILHIIKEFGGWSFGLAADLSHENSVGKLALDALNINDIISIASMLP